VGCLNGSLVDLFRILNRFGSPARQSYLFLGGLGNGAEFGTHVVCLVLLMKVLWPTHVYVLRGADEFAPACDCGGFKDEVALLYGGDNTLYWDVIRAFAFLPLAALLNERVFCVHGGISQDVPDLSVVLSIRRPRESLERGIIAGLLCSEPTEMLPMFLPASTGLGCLFGCDAVTHFLRQNGIELIVRTFGAAGVGCVRELGGQVVTILSHERGTVRAGALHIGLLFNEFWTWDPGHAPLRRTDVTLLTSASPTRFVLPAHFASFDVVYRNAIVPACPRLRTAATGSGVSSSRSREIKVPGRSTPVRPTAARSAKPAPIAQVNLVFGGED
jgi:protein phosphatase